MTNLTDLKPGYHAFIDMDFDRPEGTPQELYRITQVRKVGRKYIYADMWSYQSDDPQAFYLSDGSRKGYESIGNIKIVAPDSVISDLPVLERFYVKSEGGSGLNASVYLIGTEDESLAYAAMLSARYPHWGLFFVESHNEVLSTERSRHE